MVIGAQPTVDAAPHVPNLGDDAVVQPRVIQQPLVQQPLDLDTEELRMADEVASNLELEIQEANIYNPQRDYKHLKVCRYGHNVCPSESMCRVSTNKPNISDIDSTCNSSCVQLGVRSSEPIMLLGEKTEHSEKMPHALAGHKQI